MKEIRRIIEDNTDRYGHVVMKELVQAFEQYIIKARIDESDYHIPDAERVAELKKGLNK